MSLTLFAAPRLRKFLRAVTQGSQSLALGLALVAASQLISSCGHKDFCSKAYQTLTRASGAR